LDINGYFLYETRNFFLFFFCFFSLFSSCVLCLSLSVALVYFVSILDGTAFRFSLTFIYGDVDDGEDDYDDNVDVEGNVIYMEAVRFVVRGNISTR